MGAATLDPGGAILIAGTTASRDFPIVSARWPERPGGSEAAFLAKVHSNGSRILFSTWLPFDFLEPFAVATDAGGEEDIALALAVDENEVAWLTGYTDSGDFPAEHLFGRSASREANTFVTGIDTVGGRITMAAILAGERFERGDAIAVDDDSVWVGGFSTSRAFPVRRAVRRNVPGGAGAFVARIRRDRPRLMMSTRLRGAASPQLERLTGLALDAKGDAWVVGRGGGGRFPVAGDQEGLGSCLGGARGTSFLAHVPRRGRKLPTAGCLAPATSGEVIAEDLAILPDGRIVVAGGASGAGFPLVSSLQASPAGRLDAFLMVLDASRGTLDLSTLYGARRGEFATHVGIGPDGRIVIAGQTETKRFPVFRALQPEKLSRAGIWDTFLLKLRP